MSSGSSQRLLFRLLLAVYLVVLVRVVLLKIPLGEVATHLREFGPGTIRAGYAWANFIPFKTLYYYLSLQEDAPTGLRNIGGNIVLFIPYGFLLPLAFTSLNALWRLAFVVFLTSFGFELVQLLIAIGNFDVDDLILNTLGGIIGGAILRSLRGRG